MISWWGAVVLWEMRLSDGAGGSLELHPALNTHLFALRCDNKCIFRTRAVKYSLKMHTRGLGWLYLQEGALEKGEKRFCTCVLHGVFEGSLKRDYGCSWNTCFVP